VDLISTLVDIWKSLPVEPRLVHVRGHQDDLNRPLTFLETLNVRMDALAKSIAQGHIQAGRNLTVIPSQLGVGTVQIAGELVCSNIQHALYRTILHQDMVMYLSSKFSLDGEIVNDSFDWDCFKTAGKEATFSLKKFISKWISADTPTGVVMQRRKQRIHSHCPRCNADKEDLLHILTCASEDIVEHRQNLLIELEVWFETEDTHPDIQTFFLDVLYSWFEDPHADEPRYNINSATVFNTASDQLENRLVCITMWLHCQTASTVPTSALSIKAV
jgi:hypothetical protein